MPLRPGITFTYLGLKVDDSAAVHFGGTPSANLFVAGEMMAGNVLGKGYTAGVGMSIGTAFGRIAGAEAASSRHSSRMEFTVQKLEALAREAQELASSHSSGMHHSLDASPPQIIRVLPLTDNETEVARQMQICNACRYCEGLLRGVSGHDAPARIRQGRHQLPRQPLPQLRRVLPRLPVRAAA